MIHGNHDPLDSTKLSMKLPSHVHVFGVEPGSVTAKRRSDHQEVAVISGMSYPTSKVTDNIALRYPAPLSGLYHIGLLHANVDGDPQHETYAPCSRKDLIRSGYHYWALGHVHTRRTHRRRLADPSGHGDVVPHVPAAGARENLPGSHPAYRDCACSRTGCQRATP